MRRIFAGVEGLLAQLSLTAARHWDTKSGKLGNAPSILLADETMSGAIRFTSL